MREYNSLVQQRDIILAKIRAIEESSEGIDNANNALRVQELNKERTKLTSEKQKVTASLTDINARLEQLNTEIARMSGAGIERILNAIQAQRWYFLKNHPKMLFDKLSGLLWANLGVFPYRNQEGHFYSSIENVTTAIDAFHFTLDGFRLPNPHELWRYVAPKNAPFRAGSNYRLNSECYWLVLYNNDLYRKDCDSSGSTGSMSWNNSGCLFPCSSILVDNTDYQINVNPDNKAVTDKERAQYTLNLLIANQIQPIFEDEEITKLFYAIFVEKPRLQEELQRLQEEIDRISTKVLLSSRFDYEVFLQDYDIPAIDSSVIKYYQAVQKWCNELMDKLSYYEEQKGGVIRDFNVIGLKLSKRYEELPNLTREENDLLRNRQRFFAKNFALGMSSVQSKILAVKKQADELEYRLDEIDNGDRAIHDLAILEQEPRASFLFVAENTAKILRNALKKIEFFEDHHDFVMNAIDIWEKWSEDFIIFKTTYKDQLKSGCEEDGIEEEEWGLWYDDWNKLRFLIEEKIQPVIERGLKGEMEQINPSTETVPEQLIRILYRYKQSIDTFFKEERKGIYQKFVFQTGGDLQDKFETESILYRYVSEFQNDMQDILFNCKNVEDRVWILNWANSLLDIQIDEILTFVADKNLMLISREVLNSFAKLKQKNYEVYLSDIRAYSQEKANREKEYNSLIFKMRKDLMKR